MSEVGSLVAATGRWSSGNVWLYRVTKSTPQRVYVEIVEQPKGGWSRPTHGRIPNEYLHATDAIPVRDMEHFAAIVKAKAELERAKADIDGAARAKHRAAFERYQTAIA